MNEAIYVLMGGSSDKYMKFTVNSQGYWQQTGTGQTPGAGAAIMDTIPSGKASDTGNSYQELYSTANPIDPDLDTDLDTGNTTVYTGGDMGSYQDIFDAIQSGEYRKEYDFNDDGILDVTDLKTGQLSGDLDTMTESTIGEDDWRDLSQQEYQALLEGGGQEELIAGLNIERGEDEQWTTEDFRDVFDETKLGFIEEGYDLDTAKLASDQTITGGILQSNLDTAKGQYGRGLQAAGYNVGKSLFDVKQQVEGQQSKGGFAGSGFVAATGERAKRGLFQDYRAQQRELAAGLGE